MEDALRKFISGFNVGTPLRTEIVEKLTGSETDTLQSIASDKVKISVKPSRETIQIGEEKALLLNDYGIVILDVVIDNQSESAIKVDNSAFRLVLFNGKQISPSGVSAIFPHLEKRSYSGDITSVFLGPIIAVAVTSNEEAIKRERRQSFENQLESKSLHNVNLKPGQSTHGLIFFIPSTDTANFNEAQLLAWFKDQENRSFRQDYLLNDVAYSNSTQNENK
jgi:hypothetical protein